MHQPCCPAILRSLVHFQQVVGQATVLSLDHGRVKRLVYTAEFLHDHFIVVVSDTKESTAPSLQHHTYILFLILFHILFTLFLLCRVGLSLCVESVYSRVVYALTDCAVLLL